MVNWILHPLKKGVVSYLGFTSEEITSGVLSFLDAASERNSLLTLFSKAQCPQCDMTKQVLNKKGLEFTEIRIDEVESALAEVKEMGYLQAPVVILPDGTHWGGFRPDLIAQYL